MQSLRIWSSHVKLDGSQLIQVNLDKAQQNNMEHKVKTFSGVYKELIGKDVDFEFPEFQLMIEFVIGAVPWRQRLRRGARTVIHPKARIIVETGPIVIGKGNLTEEQALIINASSDNITPDTGDPEPKPMIIGTNNVFEVGCHSQAMKMGDNNVIELKAYVGRNVILTSGCLTGACGDLNTFEVIPENTVIYGADCLRWVQAERPQPQTLQLDFSMKILPNYHHLKKTMKGSSAPVKN
nr:dynactin subunit 6-like [Symphalangus syndactylus]